MLEFEKTLYSTNLLGWLSRISGIARLAPVKVAKVPVSFLYISLVDMQVWTSTDQSP